MNVVTKSTLRKRRINRGPDVIRYRHERSIVLQLESGNDDSILFNDLGDQQMSNFKRIFLIALAPIALLAMGAEAHAQASDVECTKCVDTTDIASKAITTGKLGAQAVTTVKIADQAITGSKIANQTVTSSHIAPKAISSAKIKNGAVTIAKVVPKLSNSIGTFCAPGQTVVGKDFSGNFVCEPAADPYMPPHVLSCGPTIRPVNGFVPGFPAIDVMSGCSPSAATIGMAVTRSGAALLDQVELQDFLNGGGSVICEWNVCDEVFNMAFNAAVVQGTRLGDCGDFVQPEVQMSFNDNLWRNVDYVPPAAGQSGCGYDMQAYPGITALGGWTEANSVSLAYRDLGLGRLWLVEADWQDGQVKDTYRYSRSLLGYMLTHVR